MLSQVDICNEALLRFGSITIMSIDDETREARACKTLWDNTRDVLLSSHPWKFAMKRADLGSPLAVSPVFGYEYAYALPLDCLCVWESEDPNTDWLVESGQYLTNIESPKIRYIAKVTDTSKYVPIFVQCLATSLAAALSAKLTEDKGKLRASFIEELESILIPRARLLNAIEKPKTDSSTALNLQSFTWVTEGR